MHHRLPVLAHAGFIAFVALASVNAAAQSPQTEPAKTRDVTVAINLPEHAAGTLVVGWNTLDEEKGASPGTLLTTQIQRFQPIKVTAEQARVQMTLEGVPQAATKLYAVLDTTEQFWGSLWGNQGAGNHKGEAEIAATATTATLTLDKALTSPPEKERCTGDRYRVVPLPDIDPNSQRAARNLCAYVPASYAEQTEKRYPVIFVTPGLFSSHTSKMVGGGSYPPIVDDLGHDAILVGVDTRHTVGSVYFTDSARTGDFSTWMRDVVIPAVDTTFRTTKNPDERALIGGSTGGFNALRLAQTLPEYFGAVAVLKPDGLDFASWMLDDGKMNSLWLSWMRLEDAVGGPGQLTSYAAHFSPDANAPRGYAWPVDLSTGEPNATWDKWLAYSPVNLLRADTDVAATFRQRFDGRLFFAVGQNDEFDLAEPTQRFCDALDAQGMGYSLRVDEGGHFSHAQKRQRAGLNFLMSAMERPRDVTAASVATEAQEGAASMPATLPASPTLPAPYVQARLPTAIQIDPGPPPLRWYGFFANVSAGTKNIGVGMAFRYLGLVQTNVSTDFLMTSLLNGLALDDLDAFRLSASQTIGFRIKPWPFGIDWRHVVSSRSAVPDIIIGAGGWTVLEVDHAAQFFRQGDAGFFSGTAVGVFSSLAFRDITMNLSWRPFGVTMYWVDGRADSTPFAVGNPILDISLTYNLPI